MAVFIKKILFPILLFTAAFILVLHFPDDTKATNINYTLKAYKNTVALYNGEKIVNIYDSIVLNTLPQKDIQNFKSGIPVASPEQAAFYLEDFDG